MSATLAQNLMPWFDFISSAHALNSLPGGESAPAPRNHGSHTVVSLADGTSPSIICFAWYQPMPRFGTPQPTSTTSHVPAVAPPRRRWRASAESGPCSKGWKYEVMRLWLSRDAPEAPRRRAVHVSATIDYG